MFKTYTVGTGTGTASFLSPVHFKNEILISYYEMFKTIKNKLKIKKIKNKLKIKKIK